MGFRETGEHFFFKGAMQHTPRFTAFFKNEAGLAAGLHGETCKLVWAKEIFKVWKSLADEEWLFLPIALKEILWCQSA
jgi:hypothetical protein